MTRTGYDRGKRNVLRRCLNIASDGADVTCDGRLFQKVASETGKARLPTVQRLNGGAASWFVEVDRSLCRDGTSAKRVKYDDRYVYIYNQLCLPGNSPRLRFDSTVDDCARYKCFQCIVL